MRLSFKEEEACATYGISEYSRLNNLIKACRLNFFHKDSQRRGGVQLPSQQIFGKFRSRVEGEESWIQQCRGRTKDSGTTAYVHKLK